MGFFLSNLVILSAIAGSLATPVSVKREDGALADFALDRRSNFTSTLALARRGSAPNYNQDYTTGGTVSYSPGTSSFSVNWNTQNDFVVGKGWTTGSTSYEAFALPPLKNTS
jgi:endo-1,4-beta-xylanase